MKTLIKLIILLTVLGICLPARAEILIYSSTIRAWVAEDIGDNDWDIYTDRIKGFLILDVNVLEGQIAGIDNAMQIDYGKYRAEKWIDEQFHNIDIEIVGQNDNVQYVLTESDFADGDFRVSMLTGEARNYDIGLQNQLEIPRQLKGYTLWHAYSDVSQICDIDMRIQQKFTRAVNEQEMDFNGAYGIVQSWLRQRGWYDGGQDDGGGGEDVTGNIEGFENGYFGELWRTYGYASWYVTTDSRNTGTYSARAGSIEDNEVSNLELVADCKQGQISFYFKVSCEESFDFLRFNLDGFEKGRWSGQQDWQRVSFPVEEGTRSFRWDYVKDDSNSRGDDTVYIDNVIFPGN